QYRGRLAGPRSDQFSFCVALYEALYKALPFEGSTFETLGASVLAGRVRPRPPGSPVPRQLHAALVRGLAVEPDQRFASMKELLAALAFDPEQDPAAAPLSRRVFSASLVVMAALLISLFIRPTLRQQNTVEMALASAVMLFCGVGLATLLLRRTLLRNAFHRGIVLLILSLTGQEALISTVAYLTHMTVAQTVALELVALVTLCVPMTYFFFRRGWLIVPAVLAALGCVLASPQDAGLIAMLVHVLAAVAAIWLWGRSAGAPELRPAERGQTDRGLAERRRLPRL
ncbi:MAG: hypothetical protein U1A78_40815, partial [Polyangia bacterium]